MRNLNVNIANSHEDAEKYDIAQMRRMSSTERLEAAITLQKRKHGENVVRVRDSGVYHIRSLKDQNE